MTSDYHEDELVTVQLSRKRLDVLDKIIEREEFWNYLVARLRGSAVFVVAGGLLTLFLFGEKIYNLLIGVR